MIDAVLDRAPERLLPRLVGGTLAVAVVVLLAGWGGVAVVSLIDLALSDRLRLFPLVQLGLPVLVVMAGSFVVAARAQRAGGHPLVEATTAGAVGFLLGSLPALAVLPGPVGPWVVPVLLLTLPALLAAGLAGAQVRSPEEARA